MSQNQRCLCRGQETGNSQCGMILTENTCELQGDMKIRRLLMGEGNLVWNVWRMRLGLQFEWKMLCGKEGRQIFLTTPRRMQIRTSWGKKWGQSCWGRWRSLRNQSRATSTVDLGKQVNTAGKGVRYSWRTGLRLAQGWNCPTVPKVAMWEARIYG